MARTSDPHAATVKAWLTRKRNADKAGASASVAARAFGMGSASRPIQEREFAEREANPLWKEPRPEFDYAKEGVSGKRYDAFRKREEAWISAMKEAVSLGEVGVEEAHDRGLGGVESVVELPSKLYHVTTAAGAVMRDGLKTRDELSQGNGVGLGGGDSDTVSFTTDPGVAKDILRAIRDAHDFVTGKTTIADLDADAAKGMTTGGKPFPDEGETRWYSAHGKDSFALLRAGYDPNPTTGAMKITEMPAGARALGEGWMGGDGVRRISGYYPKLVRGSAREKELRWDLFRSYLTARAQAGGPMDPLFYGVRTGDSLARQSASDIRIVEVEPRAGSRGFRMSALGEIRIWTGKVVKKQRLVSEDE